MLFIVCDILLIFAYFNIMLTLTRPKTIVSLPQEQRRQAMKLVDELKMPVEDMQLKHKKELPKFKTLQGKQIIKTLLAFTDACAVTSFSSGSILLRPSVRSHNSE